MEKVRLYVYAGVWTCWVKVPLGIVWPPNLISSVYAPGWRGVYITLMVPSPLSTISMSTSLSTLLPMRHVIRPWPASDVSRFITHSWPTGMVARTASANQTSASLVQRTFYGLYTIQYNVLVPSLQNISIWRSRIKGVFTRTNPTS